MKAELIAPCGINCGVCLGYLREKNHCPGCRVEQDNKAVSVLKCIIINCEVIKHNESGFCFECDRYPCRRLKALDKRYRTRYRTSLLDNLEFIRRRGLAAFIEKEKVRWRCPVCGGTICIHRDYCYDCRTPLTPPDQDVP
jgi:hypothetical protein